MFLHGAPGGPVILFAGDEVPEGSEVGAHLLATEGPAEANNNDEGGAADESGDTEPSEGPVLEVEPEPADDGQGIGDSEPKPAPAKRAARQAKA